MQLKKPLGVLGVFCIAAGAMISSGLFVLPGLVFKQAGPAMILSYLFAGVLMIPSVLSQAELTTAMPKAGGTYFYIERSLGAAAGTLAGFANWFSISFKSAFALVGLGVFAKLLFPGIDYRFIAVACCLFFTVLNLVSVKGTGKFQVFLVLGLLGMMVLYVLAGSRSIDVHKYVPFGFDEIEDIYSVFAATGLVFISYGGLTKVASVSEEVRRPGRDIPMGMFLAFAVVSILYVLVVSVTVGLVPRETLEVTRTPISDGAGNTFMGTFGGVLMAVAALLAFVSTANAGILSASRSPMAMGRDQVLPRVFAKVNHRFKTPHISILMTSAFMICVILFLSFENLVKTASTLMLLLFVFVNLSVIIMRESKIRTYKPTFKSPLYPYLQIFAIIAYAFLIFEMGYVPLAITGGFTVLGLLWYLFYARKHVSRQSALIHVVERIADRKLGGGTLESELKDIIIERDEIIEDRFDRLIKECEVIDAEGPLSLREFFHAASITMSDRLGAAPDALFDLLMKREAESTTVIRPGLAIPHVIVEGEGKFDILLARCRKGIRFSESTKPVHMVFVLAGSRDQRNFHLRALMAIAQIAQHKDFEKDWLNAADLRNIILLSERKRDAPSE
ncbi:MAG: amino acid permease [Planctomycetia bacterium]|nr:amino acid permease [Planctomycetia bacterium]